MTREQKIARARELRAEGLTYSAVGKQLGTSYQTIRRWLDPDYAEKVRQISRAYKAQHRKALRAYDREYDERHKAECPECGAEVNRRFNGEKCMACRADSRDRRARQIESWWAEGLPLKKIAERLGWTKGSLSREMYWMREVGYSLPYRHTLSAPKWSEQVAA